MGLNRETSQRSFVLASFAEPPWNGFCFSRWGCTSQGGRVHEAGESAPRSTAEVRVFLLLHEFFRKPSSLSYGDLASMNLLMPREAPRDHPLL